MSKIQLSSFIDEYLHERWLSYNSNEKREFKITIKPKDKFNNDLNINGYIKDEKYEYHALYDTQSIVIVRTYRNSPLAYAILATVVIDRINPLTWVGIESVSLQSIDVSLISAIEHSSRQEEIEFKNEKIDLWY